MAIACISCSVATLLWETPQAHAQTLGCGLSQITRTTGDVIPDYSFAYRPSINADGSKIAFASSADLTGNNPDGNSEIFLYDRTTNSLTQITNTVGRTSEQPSISADGTRIAFVSSMEVASFPNPDADLNIVLYDTTTGNFTLITQMAGGGNTQPAISGDGQRIAFMSPLDLSLLNQGIGGNYQLFLYDPRSALPIQVTSGSGPLLYDFPPSINFDGSRIVFSSQENLTGLNSDGNLELFLYSYTYDGPKQLIQITNTTRVYNRTPSISADGQHIAFGSDLNSGNPSSFEQIFLYDVTAGSFSPITSSPNGDSSDPSISPDGGRIAFISYGADLTGGNVDGGEEIYLYETSTGSFTQVTNTPFEFIFGRPAISNDASVVFTAEEDLVGANPDKNNELFLASCSGTPPTGTPTPTPTPTPAPPVANDDAYTTHEHEQLFIAAPGVLANDTSPISHAILRPTLVTAPAHAQFFSFGDDGGIDYISPSGFSGTDTFTYRFNDGNSDSNVATVTITVIPAPIAVADRYSVFENTTLRVSAPGVLQNDLSPSGAPLTAIIVTNPSNGSISLNDDGSFIYTPAAGFTGGDTFAYRDFDGHAFSGFVFVVITISPPNVNLEINGEMAMVSNSGLPASLKTALIAKLQAFLRAIQAGDLATACSDLQDFIDQVNAQRGKKIPTSLANSLVGAASQIQGELGCGNVALATTLTQQQWWLSSSEAVLLTGPPSSSPFRQPSSKGG